MITLLKRLWVCGHLLWLVLFGFLLEVGSTLIYSKGFAIDLFLEVFIFDRWRSFHGWFRGCLLNYDDGRCRYTILSGIGYSLGDTLLIKRMFFLALERASILSTIIAYLAASDSNYVFLYWFTPSTLCSVHRRFPWKPLDSWMQASPPYS